MALSWNEIKNRALSFTKEWEGETRGRAGKTVDLCFRPQAITSEMCQIEFLSELYEGYLVRLMIKKK
ncbi:hypothetical protein ACPUEN_12960 [Algoriphagus yeomjeoni]|uniref:hypothetical protein n=1 Tax=Algoriphagus yeomjeoni TaxID=291403 RepID=UPI003CE51B41